MNWNQPMCAVCWNTNNPDRGVAIDHGRGDFEQCAYCGRGTTTGIYVRAHPSMVSFPAEDDDA